MQLKSFWGFVLGVAVTTALIVPVMSAHAGKQGPSREEMAKKSDEIVVKLRQLDLLNRLVPLLLTRDQLEKTLAAIEKARVNVRKTQENEYKVLVGMEAKLTALVDKDIAEGIAPGRAPIIEFGNLVAAMGDTRMVVARDNEDLVYDALWPLLDSGQKKALAGSIPAKEVAPNAKVEDIKDEQLVRYFIRDTFLDPNAYPILVSLLKNAIKG